MKVSRLAHGMFGYGTKYLGEEFDIHGGGMDLMFPHHECEIAQSTSCTRQGNSEVLDAQQYDYH